MTCVSCWRTKACQGDSGQSAEAGQTTGPDFHISHNTRPPEWIRRERSSYVFASYSFSLTFSSLYCIYICSLVPCGSIDISFKSYTTFLVLFTDFLRRGGR